MAKTTDALKILEVLHQDEPEIQKLIKVAQMIYSVRTDAGLTQKQLADQIGIKQSVIARLEDADYEGYSLSMLQRIAEALNQKVEIQLTPIA